MKHKILASILVFTSILTLSACGSSADSFSAAASTQVKDEGSSEARSEESTENFSRDEELVEDTLEENTVGDDIVISNSGRPYFELELHPENFSFAGYSLADGDHFEEALQIVSENCPAKYDDDYNVIISPDYTGWYYWRDLFPHIYVNYRASGYNDYNIIEYKDLCYIEYAVRSQNAGIRVHLNNTELNNDILPLNEYSFIEGPITIGMRYDEVISVLKLENLIDLTVSKGRENKTTDNSLYYTLFFESQYGVTCCMYFPETADSSYSIMLDTFTSSNEDNIPFVFSLDFNHDMLIGYQHSFAY